MKTRDTRTRRQPTTDHQRIRIAPYLVNIHFLEGALQNFEVLYVFMFQVGAKFDTLHGHGTGEQHIHVLTVGSSWNKGNNKYIGHTMV